MAKRRWRKAMKWTLRLLGVALLGAVGAGWYVYDYPRAAADLPKAVLAYRNAGLPWTAKDLAPNPPVKPNENAAPLLRAAIDVWPHRTGTDDPRSADLDVRSVQILAGRFDPVLALAHRAAQRPRRDWDLDRPNESQERTRIARIVGTFALRAECRARAGDDEGAILDLDDARRIAALSGQRPTTDDAFAALGEDGAVCDAAQRCLAQVAKDSRRLVRYRAWLEYPPPLLDFHRALRGDILLSIDNVRSYERYGMGTASNPFAGSDGAEDTVIEFDCNGPKVEDPMLRQTGLPSLQRPRAYLANLLRIWARLSAATHDLTDPMNEIEREANQEATWRTDLLTPLSLRWTFGMPDIYPGTWRKNLLLTARRAVTLAYADALIQHARTGTWPSSSTVPDPLGEGTLKVRIDQGRFRIYSVGEDGRDNDGFTNAESTAAWRGYSDDLVAAYPPVPRHIPRFGPPVPPIYND